jgi:DNA mismatch repair ATPase MutL
MANLFLILFFVSFIALIAGLVKPTAFSRFIKGEMTRKKSAAIFGIATIASFVLFGITADNSKNNTATQQPATENTQATTESESQSPTPANVTENQTSSKTEDRPASTTALAPTQVKQTDNQNIAPTSSETVSQKNAVAKAKSYLGYSAFSHDGLVDQLEYEQFLNADAVYGADNSGANWNEQVAKKAKSYMAYSAFSRGSLIEQLKYDKFTQAQAEYGVNAVGL